MLNVKNFIAHPTTTLGGALLGLLQASIGSAAAYTQTGNFTDWKPYAAAAATGAVTFIVGGLLPSLTKASAAPAALPEAASAAPKGKDAILASIDAALTQAAQAAMLAEASKLTGINLGQQQVGG